MRERIRCAHEDRCGGCPLIGLPYSDQLAQKGERVRAAFARFTRSAPGVSPAIEPPIAADPVLAYRTRAKLMVGARGEVGLFAKDGAHVVVDTPHCRVLAPSLHRTAAHIRSLVANACDPSGTPNALRPFDPTRPDAGGLRAVDLREAVDGESTRVLVTLVMAASAENDLAALREAAEAIVDDLPAVAGVAVNVHDGDSPQVLGRETRWLAGAESVADRVGRSLHAATFGSFAQAHRGQADRIHALLADSLGLVGPGTKRKAKLRVLDLYGGSGAIGLGLAAAGASVHLVETFAPAAAQAGRAAREQELDLVAESKDATAALRHLAARGERFDAAVVNPPRRGTSPETREALARLGPGHIAYVSCDPGTLARDIDHLARLGYSTAWIKPFDMIPLSEHVETVALLLRGAHGETAAPSILWAGSEAFAVDKAAHEPTMPQGEYASSLLARVRTMPQYGGAIPLHRLDVGTSGALLFVRKPEGFARWQALAADRRTVRGFIAAVRGATPARGVIIADRARRQGGEAGRFRRLAAVSGHSVLHVLAGDDARHAIRRGLTAMGHPVLGDDRYGHRPTNRHFEEKHGLDRTFLHAATLAFTDPAGGARRRIVSPLPGELRLVLERMAPTDLPDLAVDPDGFDIDSSFSQDRSG